MVGMGNGVLETALAPVVATGSGTDVAVTADPGGRGAAASTGAGGSGVGEADR